MARINYAAIDIGSNAARLLIKSIDREANDKNKFKKLLLLRVPLRLGFDIFKNGALSDKKAEKLRRLMKAYRQMMKLYDVADYRACATSAMRDATNGPDIIRRIYKETGINIEIINGKEEMGRRCCSLSLTSAMRYSLLILPPEPMMWMWSNPWTMCCISSSNRSHSSSRTCPVK